jgi:HSP20 family molecular chaperone IbpA
MANFFEKLKKGMGIEIPTEEEKKTERVEEKKEEKIEVKEREGEKGKRKEIQLEKREEKIKQKEWPEPEGELAIDMYQTDEDLVIQSAIAGVRPEELNLYLEGGVLFIEGERKKPSEERGEYFLQECYWGRFSRKIVLPVEINPEKISASFKDGILTIRIQKISRERKRKILIKS